MNIIRRMCILVHPIGRSMGKAMAYNPIPELLLLYAAIRGVLHRETMVAIGHGPIRATNHDAHGG